MIYFIGYENVECECNVKIGIKVMIFFFRRKIGMGLKSSLRNRLGGFFLM